MCLICNYPCNLPSSKFVFDNVMKKTIFTWREDVLGEPGGGHWHDDIALNAAPLSLGRTSVGEADKAKLG